MIDARRVAKMKLSEILRLIPLDKWEQIIKCWRLQFYGFIAGVIAVENTGETIC